MSRNQEFANRFLKFAVSVLHIVSRMPRSRGGRHIADQLFRSGTAPGAHLQEARSAESRADFLHKYQLALKEIREAAYWLALAELSEMIGKLESMPIRQECEELTAILAQSVLTAKKNAPQTSDSRPLTSDIL